MASVSACLKSYPRSLSALSPPSSQKFRLHFLPSWLKSLRKEFHIYQLNGGKITYLSAFLRGYCPARVHIEFVSNQHADYLLVYIFAHFFIPFVHFFKWFSVCKIINDDNAISSSVVSICNGSKSFLPSCVPLHKNKYTSTTFTLSLRLSTNFTFLIIVEVRNQRRWCWAYFGWTYFPTWQNSYCKTHE